jgi:predicted GNAT superfamily acetyltransferase
MGAIVVVIVWQLDLQLPMQSVRIPLMAKKKDKSYDIAGEI